METYCEECSGQGRIIVSISKGETTECPICNGTGESHD